MLAQLGCRGAARNLTEDDRGWVSSDAGRAARASVVADILRPISGTRYPVVVDFPAGHCAGRRRCLGHEAVLDAGSRQLRFAAAR
jgi:hypothetical protein